MKKEDLSVGITGFIDILGFGEKVKNSKTIEDIEDIRSSVKKIQNEFDFETEDKLTAEVQQLNSTTVLAFSDCVVVNIPLESESTKYSGTFDPIMSELAGFAYAQGNCVQDSLFIRGGLELGWWYQEGHTLISQSMVGAVKREESACVPVIALCEEIYNYLSDHGHRKFYSEDYDPIRGMFRKYCSDKEEFFYIDYISICVEALDWHRSKNQMSAYRKASPDEKDEIMVSGYRENVDIWLSNHARNIESAANLSPNDKVKDKYKWLASYHNDVTKSYSTNEECICKI
ncbi:hypothetical protein [Marinobacter xestospongiae]|uniref:hypothetical protein n=1 Tax=Marinobacter xestospongiae TaxID=994319 RepID=UPI002005440B|nr:hypothetical protein [Marinobacter xestospongiae]MCK7569171.1 hypothetical protein [Marinobacter xestospongiae]